MEAVAPDKGHGIAAPTARAGRALRLWSLALLVVTAVLPLLPFTNNYILAVVVRALIFIALGQAWNIVAGIGGQLSLGHGVFLGLGCYVTALLFNHFGLTPWIGAWGGVLVCIVVALVMGVMTLRMRGLFFALATVAISLAFDEVAKSYVGLTGGDNGLALKFFGNSLWAAQWRTPEPFVYAGLVFVVAYYWITRRILTSQFGLELRAVRDDEEAAAAAGVRVFRTKVVGFIVSAALTGLAGALYMQFYQSIDPETAFGLSQAIQLQLPALIGGLGTASGPIIGGAVMVILAELTNLGSTRFGLTGVDILVYGLLLLVVILRAPTGIVGLLRPSGGRGKAR
jgi:branched-chain amino acid transport system permease protein